MEAIIPGDPGRKDFSLYPQDVGVFCGLFPFLFGLVCFMLRAFYFILPPKESGSTNLFKKPVLNRQSRPSQDRKWPILILPTGHPPWRPPIHGSLRAGGSRLSNPSSGKELMSADPWEARSTMMHTKTPCSRRAASPIGLIGKMPSRVWPSRPNSKNNEGVYQAWRIRPGRCRPTTCPPRYPLPTMAR